MEQIYEKTNYVMSGLTSQIIGCAIKVHRALGPGYEEAYYQKALVSELVAAGLDVEREVEFGVYYKDMLLGIKRVDLVVGDCLVELRAKKGLEEIDAAQVVSYLKASGYPLALLINFGGVKVQTKRFVNTQGREAHGISENTSASHNTQRLSDSRREQPSCPE
jgi:GxxExxY protein